MQEKPLKEKVDGKVGDCYVLGSGVVQVEIFNTVPDKIRIVQLAIDSKLPAIFFLHIVH